MIGPDMQLLAWIVRQIVGPPVSERIDKTHTRVL
jgi:hypothetical protein